jgi:hypothetical protein
MAPSSQEFGVFFASIRGGSAEFGLDKQMSESNNEGIRGRSPDMVYAMVSSRITPQLAENADYQAILGRMAFPKPIK